MGNVAKSAILLTKYSYAGGLTNCSCVLSKTYQLYGDTRTDLTGSTIFRRQLDRFGESICLAQYFLFNQSPEE
jgi:hypothetical protein